MPRSTSTVINSTIVLIWTVRLDDWPSKTLNRSCIPLPVGRHKTIRWNVYTSWKPALHRSRLGVYIISFRVVVDLGLCRMTRLYQLSCCQSSASSLPVAGVLCNWFISSLSFALTPVPNFSLAPFFYLSSSSQYHLFLPLQHHHLSELRHPWANKSWKMPPALALKISCLLEMWVSRRPTGKPTQWGHGEVSAEGAP